MVEEKSKSDVANFQVAYALNPISSFDSYIDKIGNIFNIAHDIGRQGGYPVLISPGGEYVSDRSRPNYETKFLNSSFLQHEDVAESIAKEKGYLFFPNGKIDDNMFSRSFKYKDFVEGANRIVQNIDPSSTCDGELYLNFIKKQCDKLEQSLKYLDDASLKWSTRLGGGNLRIVGDLDAKHIGGIKSYSGNGFNGASLVTKIDYDSRRGNVIDRIELKAQFSPSVVLDESLSVSDFNNINTAVRNLFEYDNENSLDRINMDFKDNYLNFDFHMWDRNDSRRVFTAPEMMETFTEYVHSIHNGIKGVAEIRKDERRNRRNRIFEFIRIGVGF